MAVAPAQFFRFSTFFNFSTFFTYAQSFSYRIIFSVSKKLENNEKLDFLKSRIFKNRWKIDLNQVIYTVFHAEFESGSKIGPKPSQNPIFTDFEKITTLIYIDLYRKKPQGPKPLVLKGPGALAGGPPILGKGRHRQSSPSTKLAVGKGRCRGS